MDKNQLQFKNNIYINSSERWCRFGVDIYRSTLLRRESGRGESEMVPHLQFWAKLVARIGNYLPLPPPSVFKVRIK